MGDWCRSALKFLAYTAKLVDKLSGLANGLICLTDLIHSDLQFRRDIRAAILSKVSVGVGIVLKIGIKINIVKFHCGFLH